VSVCALLPWHNAATALTLLKCTRGVHQQSTVLPHA
jgi:hypothetical protein